MTARIWMLCGSLLFVLLNSDPTSASLYTWKGGVSSDWATAANWDPQSVPGPGDQALVTDMGSSLPLISGNTEIQSLIVHGPASVTLQDGVTLTVRDGVSSFIELHAGATVTGLGTSARLNFAGASLVNDGTISVPMFFFNRAGAQSLSGSGSWTGNNVQVATGSTTALGSDVTLGPGPLGFETVGVMGTISVYGYTLNLNQVELLVGNPFLGVSGIVEGSSLIRFQGLGNRLHLGMGYYGVPTLVEAGVLEVPTALFPMIQNAHTTVAAGAELRVGTNTTLQMQGNLTVNGLVSGVNATSRLNCAGPAVVNAGIISIATFGFNYLFPPQFVSGSGQWTGNSVRVETGSTVRLTGDVTLGPNATGFINVTLEGALVTNGFTLTLHQAQMMVGNPFTMVPGAVNGPGLVRFQGPNNQLHLGAGAWEAPVLVAAGVTEVQTALIALGSAGVTPVTVASGAELRVGANTTLQVNGNMVVNGVVGGANTTSRLNFASYSIENAGVVSVSTFGFNFSLTQFVTGAGSWTGNSVVVMPGSTTRLGGNVTLGPGAAGFIAVSVQGTLLLSTYTLSLQQAQLLVGNPFTAVPGSVAGPGLVRFQGLGNELHLGAGSFDAPLLLAAGTTQVPTAVIPLGANAATTVASGAELRVGMNTTLQANGSLTVNGVISGVNSSSRLNYGGTSLVNAGTISIGNSTFNRAGAQTVRGPGSWTGGVAVAAGSITSLGSDVSIGPATLAQLLVFGTLDAAGHTISIAGSFVGIAPGGVLKGGGTVATGPGYLSNQGRIEPGASPGLLVVNGALTEEPGGTIAIEIGGLTPITRHDRLAVTGHVNLKDTLKVTLLPGYTPVIGHQFRIMSFASRSGTFDHLVVKGNFQLTPTYDDTSVVLTVVGFVGVDEDPDVEPGTSALAPSRTTLHAVTPNPSFGVMAIRFDLSSDRTARLVVFDAAGRKVRTLADERLGPGTYQRDWDRRDQQGNRVAPGVYLLRFEAGAARQTRRLVLIGG